MELSKVITACPVVGLEVVQFSSADEVFVLAASGPNLLVFKVHTSSPQLHQQQLCTDPTVIPVLDSHSITTIKHVQDGLVLVLGYKSLTLLQLHPEDPRQSSTVRHISPLRDLVLDAKIIHTAEHGSLLLMGYAQNFLDIYSLDQERVLGTAKCSSVCVLFSLAIAPRATLDENGITIASGTAMGQIVLWTVSAGATCAAPAARPLVSLTGHNGIVWKVRWSAAADRLVSVSDDRTVRVWDASTGTELFCGYGHTSRVWDAKFLGLDERAVVTCGEDAVLKLWDLALGQCVVTMRGHANKHIWCVSSLQLEREGGGGAAGDTVLLSGGNDCCVNLWPLSAHSLLSADKVPAHSPRGPVCTTEPLQEQESEEEGARWLVEAGLCPDLLQVTCKFDQPLPLWGPDVADSKPSQTVIAHRLSACGSVAVVVTQGGGLWMVSLDSNDMRDCREPPGAVGSAGEGAGATGWSKIQATERGVNAGDVVFQCAGEGQWRVQCVCVHAEGFVTFASWIYQRATPQVCPPGGEGGVVTHLSTTEWKGHQRNSMSVSFVSKSIADVCSSACFVTMSVQGECKLWRREAEGEGEGSVISLMTECRTAKSNIATSAALLSESGWLVVGDCRGNISLFSLNSEAAPSSQSRSPHGTAAPCVQFIPKAHALEAVSSILEVPGGFCSLGFDGFLSIYALQQTDGSVPQFCLVSRLPCSPITSPDQVFYTPSSSSNHTSTDPSGLEVEDCCSVLVVAGYQASEYVVYDLRRRVQLLRLDAGGCRRPHRSSLLLQGLSQQGLPAVTFVYSAMSDTRAIFKCMRCKPAASMGSLPLQLGTPSLGRVAYCATFLTPSSTSSTAHKNKLFAVGAEDGSVKVFSLEPSQHPHQQFQYKFVQEVHMPSNVAARAIFHCVTPSSAPLSAELSSSSSSSSPSPSPSLSSSSIVVAAGGRLMFAVWRYRERACLSSHPSPLGCVLEQVYASNPEACRRGGDNAESKRGKVKEQRGEESEDKQDHRILATAALAVRRRRRGGRRAHDSDHGCFVVLLCDSRGVAKLLRLTEKAQELRDSGGRGELMVGARGGRSWQASDEAEFEASSYPLLCCALLSFSPPRDVASAAASTATARACCEEEEDADEDEDNVHISVLGDTHGGIGVWLLHSSTLRGRPVCPAPREIFSYQGHTMGANAVSCLQGGARGGPSRPFTVCSGGDDQCITVGRFELTITLLESGASRVTMAVLSIQCVQAASGSALKGVRMFPASAAADAGAGAGAGGGVLLASVGYDQRLAVWGLSAPPSLPDMREEGAGDHVVIIPCRLVVCSSGGPSVHSKRKFDEKEECEAVPMQVDDDLSLKSPAQVFEAPAPVHFPRDSIHVFPPSPPVSSGGGSSHASPLQWLGGSVVNVGDVNGMALLADGGEDMIGVVGEGFQVFQRRCQ